MKRLSAKLWMAGSMVAAVVFAGCAARPGVVTNAPAASAVTDDSVPRLSAAADEQAIPAADADATTQPALPAGHPAIGGAGSPALPTGHPDISKMTPPAGAPRATMAP